MVLRVESVQPASDDDRFVASAIDAPVAGSETHNVLEVVGSVVTAGEPISSLRLVCEDEVAQAVVGIPRPDLTEHFPDAPSAVSSGFEASVSGIDLPTKWTVDVVAVIDGSEVPIAKIVGSRGRLQSSHEPVLAPVLLLTLGRTGSIWTTYLLSRHPQVVAYRPFDFEPKMSAYWMGVLETLVRPYSYLRPISPGLIRNDPTWWAGLRRPEVTLLHEEALRRHFDRDHVEAVATLCHRRLDAFYSDVAVAEGKRPLAFVEKCRPHDPQRRLLRELYDGVREIVLVRDPRDVFCSVDRFGTQRGGAALLVDNPDEYVSTLANHANSWVEAWKGGAFLLRYEDLIPDPVGTLGPTLEFIGVEASPQVVEAMCTEATAPELPQMTTHRTSPSPEASIGRWRRDLDPRIRAMLEREAGDAMLELGYEIEG